MVTTAGPVNVNPAAGGVVVKTAPWILSVQDAPLCIHELITWATMLVGMTKVALVLALAGRLRVVKSAKAGLQSSNTNEMAVRYFFIS